MSQKSAFETFADALSKWLIFKANFKDFAGEEGKNQGKQREKEGYHEKSKYLGNIETLKKC